MIKGNLTVVKFQTPNYMDSKQLHTHTKKTTTQYQKNNKTQLDTLTHPFQGSTDEAI